MGPEMGEERAGSRIGGTGNRTIKRKNVVGGARNGAKRPEVRWVGPEMKQWRTEQVGGAGNGAIKAGSGAIKAGNGGGGRALKCPRILGKPQNCGN